MRILFHQSIVFLLFLSCSGLVQSQKIETMPEPDYSIPYTIAEVSKIKKSLVSIKNYFYKVTPYKIVNNNTWEEITDFNVVDSNAVIDYRSGRYNFWIYEMGVVHTGMFYAGEVLGDSSFLQYPLQNYNFIFNHLSYFSRKAKKYGLSEGGLKRILNMYELDHCGAIGAALIQAYYYNPDERYRSMIDTVTNFIMHKNFRLDDGTLARHRPQTESLWTDDLYMSVPFLARMGELTGDSRYFDDAVKQVLQFAERLFVYEKELFDHGFNLNSINDPKYYWARANGWAMVATAELLSLLPENHKKREEILKLFRLHVKGVSEYQDGSGMWHNMLDKNDTYLESSSTAMFVYSMAKGVNEGWIDYTYGSVAITGWNALQTYIQPNGQIKNICIGTTFADDMVYYYHRPTSVHAIHGYGPALMAGSEIIKLIKNKDLYVDEGKSLHFMQK